MYWRNRRTARDEVEPTSNSGHARESPTLAELLATCTKAGTRVSSLDFVGSAENSVVAFLLVPPEDAKTMVSVMKRGIDSQVSSDKKEMNRVETSVMLHYREEAEGNVRYLFADFIVTIKDHFNKTYRILANDNIPFFEILAKSGMLGIIPSEISQNATPTDMSSIALVQMPNKGLLEELLAEVKSKVGTHSHG
jgi:hypothetical protein